MTVITRKVEETNPDYGFDPEKRPIDVLIKNGIINLDKVDGPTSHQMSDWVKKIFKINKAGHGGTLDPRVTGILPVTLGNATKIMKVFLYSGKEYVALMHLHTDVHEGKVRDALKMYVGKITQLPPKRSHVKRVEREREIYYIEFLEKKDRDVLFKVGCQHGTYIRRLCEDLGRIIGGGAHMIELRRTKAGGFSEEDHLVTLQDLIDALAYWREEGNEKFLRYCIWPVERAVRDLPKVWVFDSAVESLCRGAQLHIPGVSKMDDNIAIEKLVAVMTLKNELIGLGTSKTTTKGMAEAKNGVAVKMDRIILPAGTYPKMWKKKEEEPISGQ